VKAVGDRGDQGNTERPVADLEELRLGTRGSQLALWQAHAVASRIAESGGPPCHIVIIKTTGDRVQDAPLAEVGGKRLFVKELEEALLRHEIDIAVHSSKDMPAALPDGLAIAAVLPREDPLDAIVLPDPSGATDSGRRRQPSRPLHTIDDLICSLGRSPAIGTGSVRRIAQVVRLLPAARFVPIRGNLDTRLRKLDGGEYDALVLAAAGLKRLGFGSRISLTLPADACLPAPGQGIVAIEIRDHDDAVRRAVSGIDDREANLALVAERALVTALGGGCQTPIGALASPVGTEMLDLAAAVIALDGSRAVRGHARGPAHEAAAIGARVGADLLADGAGELLADARRTHGAVEGIQP
jgi:hydroxymethylbilane synthase